MKKTYDKPDFSEWAADDPRQKLTGFDDTDFRARYNECMPYEKPSVTVDANAVSIVEKPWIDKIRGCCLDTGCGNGENLVRFIKSGKIDYGIGIDVSDIMVDNSRKTAELSGVMNVDFLRAAIENFEPPCKFDTIIATELIEHIYNVRNFLEQVVSWLQPEGIFVGCCPLDRTCDAVVHLHYFTLESLAELLSEYFKIVHVEKIDVDGQGQYHLSFWCKNNGEENA